ncbi:hypothetical protein KDA11_06320 [Candidatus Saccharibacteria bacterium]|nr:hypothetical protein [Candidatus Saccharibacteria bacterium]
MEKTMSSITHGLRTSVSIFNYLNMIEDVESRSGVARSILKKFSETIISELEEAHATYSEFLDCVDDSLESANCMNGRIVVLGKYMDLQKLTLILTEEMPATAAKVADSIFVIPDAVQDNNEDKISLYQYGCKLFTEPFLGHDTALRAAQDMCKQRDKEKTKAYRMKNKLRSVCYGVQWPGVIVGGAGVGLGVALGYWGWSQWTSAH